MMLGQLQFWIIAILRSMFGLAPGTGGGSGPVLASPTYIGATDVRLVRDGANQLALQNGTNPQTFRLYSSYTDAANNEYLEIVADTTCLIRTAKTGTGTDRAMTFGPVGAAAMNFQTGGSTRWFLDTDGGFKPAAQATYDIGQSGLGPRNIYLYGKLTVYNSVVTAGFGVAAVCAASRVTAQVAAVASVATYTVGAADGSFEVSANVNVTTATTHAFTVTCTYTDETGTSRVLTLGFTQLSGATLLTSITNVTGAGPYESPIYHLRAKAATTITFATVGTFTSVAYNAEGIIKQMA